MMTSSDSSSEVLHDPSYFTAERYRSHSYLLEPNPLRLIVTKDPDRVREIRAQIAAKSAAAKLAVEAMLSASSCH